MFLKTAACDFIINNNNTIVTVAATATALLAFQRKTNKINTCNHKLKNRKIKQLENMNK